MEHIHNYLKHRRLFYFSSTIIIVSTFINIDTSYSREYFNPALLELSQAGQEDVDLTAFEEKDGQLPGVYRVDVFINNEKKDTRNVDFRMVQDANGKEHLVPCLPVDDLEQWGLLTRKYPEMGNAGATCADLSVISQASTDFRFSKQQLLINIPQSAMNNEARGWVDPAEWDDGATAFLLNYSLNGSNTKSKVGQAGNSQFANLRPGINIGPWRLRNYSTWTRNSFARDTSHKWASVYTYAQRGITSLKSQLTIGDGTSSSDMFDSIPFRGAQLASDDDMLPESMRGYAPVIRGIARSNAQVTIRQNGYVIYQTYVSPGSFEITDMYPTGGSGDLQVNIKESDGSEQIITVPYASLPVLQREGRLKYSLTSGAYRSYDSRIDTTLFSQGTIVYGLPAGLTVYGGGQFASPYQALAVGAGKNMGNLGAVSLDVTQAWSTRMNSPKENGRSFRARYSKNIVKTETNFAIAGYRYATNGYWDMQEVLNSYNNASRGSGSDNPASGYGNILQEKRRNRVEFTVTQGLWKNGGNLALTAVREDYWNSNQTLASYGVSYNHSFNSISYGFGYTYNLNSSPLGTTNGRIYSRDQLFSFNINVPLGNLLSQRSKYSLYSNYSMSSSKKGGTSNNLGMGGTALENANLSWGVQQGFNPGNRAHSGSINTDWRAAYGNLSAGYGYDQYSRRMNYGIQGGIIAHSEGVTLSQPLGETPVLVSAPGAPGVIVSGNTGIRTDSRGYTVVPYASPYRKNTISLDTESMGEEVDVAIVTQTVIPTRGAVVKASYKANVGYRVLMTMNKKNGQPVPFGAVVTVKNTNETDNQINIVGDAGQVYLTGLPEKGSLLVDWGTGADRECSVHYQINKNATLAGIRALQADCL